MVARIQDKAEVERMDELPLFAIRFVHLEAGHTEAERAFQGRNAQHHALFDSVNDAVFFMDNDRIMDCDGRVLDMFECTREQIIGQFPRIFTFPLLRNSKDSGGTKGSGPVGPTVTFQQCIEYKLSRYDGGLFDAELSFDLLNLIEKVVFQTIEMEITGFKRVEQPLRVESRFCVLTKRYGPAFA
ncbi:MAG: PAS domain-containing protein [Syntrophobacterales bacterium]|jgi:PAS domain-containing protein|nr:PAS domain-containing protein [Syntrophobacterales bacterium]